jgi:hypothetical protein
MFTVNIQAKTIEELQTKVIDLIMAMSIPPGRAADLVLAAKVAEFVVEEPEEPKPVTPPKTRKKKEPEHVSVEDLQALCVTTAAEVGSPAVKAMISSYSAGGIRAMTDEQRDELAAKLSNRHE